MIFLSYFFIILRWLLNGCFVVSASVFWCPTNSAYRLSAFRVDRYFLAVLAAAKLFSGFHCAPGVYFVFSAAAKVARDNALHGIFLSAFVTSGAGV